MIKLNFEKSASGLIPAIAQDEKTGRVLMLAYINEAAWQQTLATGEAHYWSRSRKEIWHKGSTSGHLQIIREILVDCDQDTVIYKVKQIGDAACHQGYQSCFYRKVAGDTLQHIDKKVFEPRDVY